MRPALARVKRVSVELDDGTVFTVEGEGILEFSIQEKMQVVDVTDVYSDRLRRAAGPRLAEIAFKVEIDLSKVYSTSDTKPEQPKTLSEPMKRIEE